MIIQYERFGVPLKDWDIKINRGILTGCNEAFIINEETRAKLIAEDPKSAEIIRPILRGKDIKRNGYEWAGLYLIVAHNGYARADGTTVARIQIENYPAIKRWLDSENWNNKPSKGTAIERLRNRTDKGDTPYNLRDCAYMDDFDKQKICYQELSQGSTFYLDQDDHFIVSNTGYILVGNDLDYLIKFLNSKFVEYCFRKFYSTTMGETGLRWLAQYIKNLPIPYKTSQIISYFESEKNQDSAIYKIFNLTQPEIDFIENSLSN